MPLLLFLGGVFALVLWQRRSPASAPLVPVPSITNLQPGQWYRLLVRSSLSTTAFGVDAPRQQLQAYLGRQALDVRLCVPDVDPYVFHVTGPYRGSTGALHDVPGMILIAVVLATSIGAPMPEAPNLPQHIDARPAPLTAGAYAGRGSLSWIESLAASREMIAGKLTAAGFTHVEVFMSANELPADWPPTERGGDVFARLRYDGAPRSLDVPPQIVAIWRLPDQSSAASSSSS